MKRVEPSERYLRVGAPKSGKLVTKLLRHELDWLASRGSNGFTSASIYRIDITNRNRGAMRSRSDSLEFALLGLLAKDSLHGYELRKRLTTILGPFRALSFSVLYPQLRRMMLAGLIDQNEVPKGGKSKRTRIVYSITKRGLARFDELTERATPSSWEDENFEVHVAFFSPTSKRNRIRILEGRLNRLQERADILRADLERSAVGLDKYLVEWRRHSLETAEREIAWLEEMIKSERKN